MGDTVTTTPEAAEAVREQQDNVKRLDQLPPKQRKEARKMVDEAGEQLRQAIIDGDKKTLDTAIAAVNEVSGRVKKLENTVRELGNTVAVHEWSFETMRQDHRRIALTGLITAGVVFVLCVLMGILFVDFSWRVSIGLAAVAAAIMMLIAMLLPGDEEPEYVPSAPQEPADKDRDMFADFNG